MKPIVLLFLLSLSALAADLSLTSDFPGGSAISSIDQKTRSIRIQPGGTLERGWVCWWYFKLDGITKSETITIDLGGGVWAEPDRAAMSLDNKTWTHTEPGTRDKNRIVYKVKVDAETAWFAWGPPFVLADAKELVERSAKSSEHVHSFELCKTKENREVPAMRVTFPGAAEKDRHNVWVGARQHAWESGGSWVCRGFVEWLLSDDPRADSMRKKTNFTIVPIMDVDNVETGNGGKSQKPHDHNRDWSNEPVFEAVRAAQDIIKKLDAEKRFDLFIDLHNPGASDKQPYFYTPAPQLLSDRQRLNIAALQSFGKIEINGPLPLDKPRTTGPEYDKEWMNISGNWIVKNLDPHVAAICLETSWNTPHSTQDGYKTVGKQLGMAIEQYLREPNSIK